MKGVIRMETKPIWLMDMDDKDLSFIREFLLSSGSLKQMAQLYSVSYPTVRHRLDQIIQKIKMSETKEDSRYINLIKRLAVEDKIDYEAASILIKQYKEEQNHGR